MEISTFLWLYLAGALLIPGRPLYAALYLLGGVYLLARLSLEHAFGKLTVERTLSDQRIFLGESVTVTLTLQNPTAIPLPWVQLLESRPAEMASEPYQQVLPLGAREHVSVSYTLHGVKRGRYAVGPINLGAGDPFGLTRLKDLRSETLRFTVYPRVSPLPDLGLPARLPMGDLATRRRLFEDPAWLTGTREYVPGDSMRRIHWNATARTGELMVKQFRHAMLLPCCVALNLTGEDYDARSFWSERELAISAAASLAHHLIERKQQVALLTTGVDPDDPETTVKLPLRQGRAALVEMLEVLARIEPASRRSFVEALADEAQRLPWGTLLCVITPRETPDLAALCARLARGGQQVLLFLTDAPGASPRHGGYQVYRLEDRLGEVVVG